MLMRTTEHAAFADDPWIVKLVDFVKNINETTQKPIVGICFGHQIIGRALGAKVGVNPGGWEISVDKINFNEQGQKLLGIKTVVSEVSCEKNSHTHFMPRNSIRCTETPCLKSPKAPSI